MCSTLDAVPAPTTLPAFVDAVRHLREAAGAVAQALATDPSLAEGLPDDLLETLTLHAHASSDASAAVATVLTGRLDRQVGSVKGKLVAGTYVSTGRFLQREAGLSPMQARVVVAPGRDLLDHRRLRPAAAGRIARPLRRDLADRPLGARRRGDPICCITSRQLQTPRTAVS